MLLALMLSILLSPPGVYAITIEEVQGSFKDAYILVVNAERSGAEVSNLINKLNQAADLIRVGDEVSLSKAINILNEVNSEAKISETNGIQLVNFYYYQVGISIFLFSAAGILVYLYGSRVFWLLWFRSKRKWRAELA